MLANIYWVLAKCWTCASHWSLVVTPSAKVDGEVQTQEPCAVSVDQSQIWHSGSLAPAYTLNHCAIVFIWKLAYKMSLLVVHHWFCQLKSWFFLKWSWFFIKIQVTPSIPDVDLAHIMRTKWGLSTENVLQRLTDCSCCLQAGLEFIVTWLTGVILNVRRPDDYTSSNIHH